MATSQIETVSSGADKAKIGAALLLALAGFVAYFLLSSQAGYIRWAALLAGLLAGAALFMFSAAGKGFWAFVQDSERELRKVVWPTRKEATRTTWVVIAVVIVLSLILAGFDFAIQALIEWFLNFGR